MYLLFAEQILSEDNSYVLKGFWWNHFQTMPLWGIQEGLTRQVLPLKLNLAKKHHMHCYKLREWQWVGPHHHPKASPLAYLLIHNGRLTQFGWGICRQTPSNSEPSTSPATTLAATGLSLLVPIQLQGVPIYLLMLSFWSNFIWKSTIGQPPKPLIILMKFHFGIAPNWGYNLNPGDLNFILEC